ncbi:MAG: hypothetical protein IJL72_04110 [Lachnospiraceae bacterium]|nr:hypothetical protein [Lachnospiraceae bacterium]
MIHEDRLGAMLRLSKNDTIRRKKAMKISKFYRNDYLSICLVRTFFMMSVAYCLLLALIALLGMEYMMEHFNEFDFRTLGAKLIIGYIIFVGVYLGIAYVLGSIRYANAKKMRREYEADIRRLDRMYLREEDEEDEY